LTQDATFIEFMREILQHLEIIYQGPVNLEYSLMVGENGESTSNQRNYQLYILECRPLNERLEPKKKPEPEIDDTKRQLFRMPTLLPSGEVDAIDYLVFVDPESYYDIEDEDQRNQIAETITALNDILPAGRFGLIGPGRWGSLDSRLSVPITYSDICNTSLLVEISPPYTPAPELAYGTEFFEGVRETGILVLGIQPMPRGGSMDWEFLRHSPNLLTHYVPWATDWADCVRVIDLNAAAGSSLRLVIDEETNEAIACFDEPATR
ncbi:MAG TPA: hypothetical protein PLC06_14030, partial [Promineifilum sp.]|nr:hypothetical protein [Promineifilum sp.]